MPEVMMNVTNSKWKRVLINEISDFINDPTIINVFPYDWFSPIDSTGKRYVLRVSKNTYCIHHFASAWVDWRVKLLVKIFGYNSPLRYRIQRLGKSFLNLISNRK